MKNRETCLAAPPARPAEPAEAAKACCSILHFLVSPILCFLISLTLRFLVFWISCFIVFSFQHWMWISLSPFASSAGPSGSKGWDACGSVPSGAYKLHVFWFSRGVCGIQGLGFCKEMNLSIHIMQLSNGPAYATDAPRLLWSHKWSSGTIPNDHSN